MIFRVITRHEKYHCSFCSKNKLSRNWNTSLGMGTRGESTKHSVPKTAKCAAFIRFLLSWSYLIVLGPLSIWTAMKQYLDMYRLMFNGTDLQTILISLSDGTSYIIQLYQIKCKCHVMFAWNDNKHTSATKRLHISEHLVQNGVQQWRLRKASTWHCSSCFAWEPWEAGSWVEIRSDDGRNHNVWDLMVKLRTISFFGFADELAFTPLASLPVSKVISTICKFWHLPIQATKVGHSNVTRKTWRPWRKI